MHHSQETVPAAQTREKLDFRVWMQTLQCQWVFVAQIQPHPISLLVWM